MPASSPTIVGNRNRDVNERGCHHSITKKHAKTQKVSGGFVRYGRP